MNAAARSTPAPRPGRSPCRACRSPCGPAPRTLRPRSLPSRLAFFGQVVGRAWLPGRLAHSRASADAGGDGLAARQALLRGRDSATVHPSSPAAASRPPARWAWCGDTHSAVADGAEPPPAADRRRSAAAGRATSRCLAPLPLIRPKPASTRRLERLGRSRRPPPPTPRAAPSRPPCDAGTGSARPCSARSPSFSASAQGRAQRLAQDSGVVPSPTTTSSASAAALRKSLGSVTST